MALTFLPDAVEDMRGHRYSGKLHIIFKKLRLIERDPLNAGEPLSRDLPTFRKVVFGNRNWRIIFRPEADGSGARIWVIGDRADSECYKVAQDRLTKLGDDPPVIAAKEAIEALQLARKQREVWEQGQQPTAD